MHIIAIDCGASFVKAAMFVDGRIENHLQVKGPDDLKSDVCTPNKINELYNIVERIIYKLSKNFDEVVLCISNEMHGFVLADSSGEPYTDYISWQRELDNPNDVRKMLNDKIGMNRTNDFIARTGMPLKSGLPSNNLHAIINRSQIKIKEKAFFYTLGDYLIRRFSGSQPFCHPSNAAATGLYDIVQNRWNAEFIRMICGSNIIFPMVSDSNITCVKGKTKFVIKPAIGDQQAALLGSNLNNTTSLSFNMGTGAQVSRLIDRIILGDYELRPYFNGYYIKTIPHIPSGRALNVYFRFIKSVALKFEQSVDDERIWKVISDTLENIEISDYLMMDLSFFENACTNRKVGLIDEIGEFDLTLDKLVASIFYYMSKNFINVAKKIISDRAEVNTVIFSGGFARRWLKLRELIIEGLDINADVVISENDTFYGCLYYASH